MGIWFSKHDMAICFVIFNPMQTKRIIMNYLYVVNRLRCQGLPVFTIELVFEGREPEIPDAFHVKGNSHMFHKERLCRLLEKKVPSRYTKLAFLDSDILFDDASWYYSTSRLLDTHDVVQPFETAHWLDLTYTEKQLSRDSIVKLKETEYNSKYHPGFAWCMRREWYNKIGFFDYAVSGSGDALSSAGWLKKTFNSKFKSCPTSLKDEYIAFYDKPAPRIAFLSGTIISHLYHGARANRQYVTRHELLETNTPITKLLKINSDGVYEWVDSDLNFKFLDYFKNRNDDDLSLESVTPIVLANFKEPLKLNSDTVLTS
uniref:Glycosyltransferase n=1 Tax=viral metagenome TaxID=1070528 RepID=A0A6C0JP78_9ZZZZ